MARMLIGLAGLFASCGWTQPTAEPQTPPAASSYDPLVIAVGYDLYSVMSVATDSALDETIIEATTFPMLDFDFDCRIESRPALVTDWAWSEGGTVLSMTLRSDISFSDGDRVTAEDVALTYQLAADPSLQSPHEGEVMRMSPGEGPRVIDDTHLRWRFTEPYNRALQLDQATSLGILPAHLLGKMDRPTVLQYAGVLPPLASGPWAMSDHVPNVGFTLTPNPQFTGPDTWRPTLDGVEFRILPDYGARLEALETGDVHVMTQVKFEDANTLAQAHPEITLYRRSSQSIDYVAWKDRKSVV